MEDQRQTNVMQPYEFSELVEGIEAALVRFESTSNHAVLRLFRRSDMSSSAHPTSPTASPDLRSGRQLEENGFLSPADNEHVFLVYL